MPNTPKVEFNFKNNNVQSSVPLLGISHVVARTTKGNFNDPSEIISSYSQFQRIYGEEIVPDGTISNIKKALEIGSKLRVSRVEGAEGVEFGVAKEYTVGGSAGGEKQTITIVLTDPQTTTNKISMVLNINTKEAGSPVLDTTGYNLNRNFYLRVTNNGGPINKIYITQFTGFTEDDQIASSSILANNLLFSSVGSSNKDITPFVEPQVFQDFVNNVPNIKLVFKSASATEESLANRIKTIDDVISTIRDYQNWYGDIQVGSTTINTNPVYMIINEGSNGGDSDADTWIKAYNAIKAYDDSYQLICSHVHQHLPLDYIEVYSNIAKDVSKVFEEVLYVEVPKYTSSGDIQTVKTILSQLKTMIPSIGYSKSVVFVGGGIKYYNDNGSLQNCDVLGTVIGLGDVSATNFGPWYSFSGMNRGVVADALGPVMENLGSPANIEELQSLAEWYFNLFVIKDTRTQGKRTMLWHGFTSHPKNDSEKFLSIVRLNLYIKKNLRPILESYLEEPNTWSTWKNIYYEGKEIMDDLVTNNAISSYEWLGDQDATSYQDLQVNNEADVRAGKYKIVLKYKDIVPLQDILIDIIIDSVNGSIDISNE